MASAASAPALSGTQKAALVLLTLGEEASAQILKQLSDEEVQSVSAAIASLPPVSLDETEAVLEHFYRQTAQGNTLKRGGIEYAVRLLNSAFGPDAKKHLDRIASPAGLTPRLEALKRVDPQRLARFLQKEHPQTIALVLAHLAPKQAATLLKSLPADLQSDVAVRLAHLDEIPPQVVERLSAVITKELKAVGEVKRVAFGGLRAVAEVLNSLDSEASDQILQAVGGQDPNLMEAIRANMFVFDDLLQIDTSGIKELLGKADRKLFTLALKGTSDRLKEHLFSCMSQRGSEMLREDIEALGPVKIRDVEAAQQQIIAVVRQLESAGVISLKGSGSEQYVL